MAVYRHIGNDFNNIEESALSLKGKKRKLKLQDFLALAERMQLPQKFVQACMGDLKSSYYQALELLPCSFMSAAMQSSYREILARQAAVLLQ